MRYLVFDTETGGLNPLSNPLMSVGAILLDGELNEISQHYALFQNLWGRSVTQRAKEVNGIDETRLKSALLPAEFYPTWDSLTNQADVLIAHNVAFDIGFMQSNGFACDADKTLDTMHIAWDVWPRPQKAGLSACYKRVLGVEPSNAHNALADAKMVTVLLEWFVENGHLSLPLPHYPVVPNFYEERAFGYVKMKEMGLIND